MTYYSLFTDPVFVNLNLFQEFWAPWILKQITKDSIYRIEEGFFVVVEIIHTQGHKMLRVLVFEKEVSGKEKGKAEGWKSMKLPKNLIYKEMLKESQTHKIEVDGGIDEVVKGLSRLWEIE